MAFAAPAAVPGVRAASRVRRRAAASATTNRDAAAAVARPPASTGAAAAVVAAALRVPPVRRAVMALGRQKILREAREIGVPWEQDVAELRAQIPERLDPLRARVEDPALADKRNLPDYYKQPFHAYPDGNLGYLPALEAEVSSRTVHAKFDNHEPLGGDDVLRGNALGIIVDRWAGESCGRNTSSPAEILDIGCSVGLSADGLARRFPGARVVGVDPSSHMLAVGALRRPHIHYIHALGEHLPVDFTSRFDIVSIQLVLHELPEKPVREIFAEAVRVLRPGGMMCVMDVDPSSFSDVNPVFLALFRSTEPFFEDHAARDVGAELENAGFKHIQYKFNTPRHRTYTAFKP